MGPAAERDVGRVFAYFEERSTSGARSMVRRIVQAVDMLSTHPELGRVAEDIEPVGRFRSVVAAPYRVIYRVEGERLLVVRVWDTRRDPAALSVPEQSSDDEPRS